MPSCWVSSFLSFGSAPDGLATLKNFVLDLVARGHGGASRGVFAAIALAFAGTAAPRVLLRRERDGCVVFR